MIWNNAWAWLGAVTLAVPLLVHLLGRRRPTPVAFPTLRFLSVAPLVPARRYRLSDIPLMIVRMAILLLAVAALAQPAFLGSRAGVGGGRVRAILVDTSASMNRPAAEGRTAVAIARERATKSAAAATTARVIETPSVRDALPGALTWLEAQSGTDELVVISDFQTPTMTQSDLSVVPAHVGVTLEAIDLLAPTEALAWIVAGATGPIETRVRLTADGTTAEWGPAAAAPPAADLPVLGGADDREAIDAAIEAARIDGVPIGPAPHPVTIVLPGTSERAKLAASARPIDAPWMFDVVNGIASDPTLVALARTTAARASDANRLRADTALRDATGGPLVSAAVSDADGGLRLFLFADVDARSVLLAALVATAARHAANVPPVAELETARIAPDELRQWERAPSAAPISPLADRTQSDGRWLWAGALLLLGVETWMRRAPRTVGHRQEAPRAHVA